MPIGKLKSPLKTSMNGIEFLCMHCKKSVKITRDLNQICLKKMKNGAYLLRARCDKCPEKKLTKFIKALDAERLLRFNASVCKNGGSCKLCK